MAFKLIYNDSPNLSYNELLVKDKSVSIHQRKVELVDTKNVKNRIAPEILSTIFQFAKKPSNLRNTSIQKQCTITTINETYLKLKFI